MAVELAPGACSVIISYPSMLRAFVLPLLLVPHANGLRVCTTLDKGFDMLLEGSSTTQISDDQLFGFNVDHRHAQHQLRPRRDAFVRRGDGGDARRPLRCRVGRLFHLRFA